MVTFASRQSTRTANLLRAGDERLVELRTMAAAALAGKVEGVAFAAGKASMTTPADGEVAMTVSGFMSHVPVRFKVEAKIASGTSDMVDSDASRAKVLAAAVAAHATALASRPVLNKAAEPSFVVDLKAVKAVRASDHVIFTSSQLPSWGLRVKAEAMREAPGRESTRLEVLSSLGSHVVTQIGLQPSLGVEADFKLPVIASLPARQLAQAAPPDWLASQALGEQVGQMAIRASLAQQVAQEGGSRGRQVNDPLKAARSRMDMQARLETEEAMREFSRTALKSGNPQVLAMDASGVKELGNGMKSGSVVWAIRYPGHLRYEEASIEVPYGADGRVNISGACLTKASLAAAKKKESDLKILSEKERSEQMKRFKAEQAKASGVVRELGVGIYAGQQGFGQNIQHMGPANLIAIRKTWLPEEFSKAGVKLLVDGMLYQTEEMDGPTGDPQHSDKWMLRLVPDGKPSQADHRLVYASLADILGSGVK